MPKIMGETSGKGEDERLTKELSFWLLFQSLGPLLYRCLDLRAAGSIPLCQQWKETLNIKEIENGEKKKKKRQRHPQQ